MNRQSLTTIQPSPSLLHRVDLVLDGLMELVLLAIVLITPWLFGGYHNYFQHLACAGLSIALVLWAIKQIIHWQLKLHFCIASLLLVVLFVVSSISLLSLPPATLKSISPEVVSWYQKFLPRQQEQTEQGAINEPVPFPAGSTLSVYPGATQQALIELLAVMVVFLLVRHSLADPERFKRFAWAMVINGCLLSIFALLQKLRATGNTIYGIGVAGEPFGPFINRNHFATYVNICIFLGLGLFVSQMRNRKTQYRTGMDGQKQPVSYTNDSWSEILQHPIAMWLLIPIATCMTGVLASLSRGGILALVTGLALALFIWRRRAGGANLTAFILIPLLAIGILAWFGASPTLARLEQEQITAYEGRFSIWQATWNIARHFPITGTGFGTFTHVEPVYRPAGVDQIIAHLHAHNEYLEAFAEGGVLRLLITLALVWLVLRAGWLALHPQSGIRDTGMMLGAWAACVTVALHSVVEFGIHLPAIASALAITGGYLVALSRKCLKDGETDSLIRSQFLGLGPVFAAIFAGTLALILFTGSWRYWQSEWFRERGLIAMQQGKEKDDLVAFQRAVDLLDMAIYCAPAHARVRMERYEVEQQRLAKVEEHARIDLSRRLTAQALVRIPTSLTGMTVIPLGLFAEDALLPYLVQASMAEDLRKSHQTSWNMQAHQIRTARNCCPVLWKPHLAIAEHVPPANATLQEKDLQLYWKICDSLSVYLDRIKLLQPHRAETWYLAGQLEWLNGQRVAAIASWRRCLELSDEFIAQIVISCHQDALQPEMRLSREEVMTRLLPPSSASQLVSAAWALHPEAKEVEARKPYMERAIELLEKREDVLSPENQFIYGMALWGVDKREQGLQNLLIAVRARPLQTEWRLNLGRLYFELEKYADAREQLQMVLRQQQGNKIAELLLQKLDELQRPGTNKDVKR